jgi:hypothetical protein
MKGAMNSLNHPTYIVLGTASSVKLRLQKETKQYISEQKDVID